jgi:beta-lactamase class D
MKNIILLFVILIISSCSSSKSKPDPFYRGRGCFLLYNLSTQTYEKKLGDTCEERLPASSTFKVPLAIMAFDSQILKDENEILKWDGKSRAMPLWNGDQNSKTWMRNSVVWFSQELTPQLGQKKVKHYLELMKYGNQDISSGLTTAWLNKPNDPRGSLAISPYEQIEFMRKLWSDKLPVSKRAMDLTRKITFREISPNGYKLSGKTGSNSYDKEGKIQLGWFIGHIENETKEYLVVTNLNDLYPSEMNSYGGVRAEELTKRLLIEADLW